MVYSASRFLSVGAILFTEAAALCASKRSMAPTEDEQCALMLATLDKQIAKLAGTTDGQLPSLKAARKSVKERRSSLRNGSLIQEYIDSSYDMLLGHLVRHNEKHVTDEHIASAQKLYDEPNQPYCDWQKRSAVLSTLKRARLQAEAADAAPAAAPPGCSVQ